LSESAVQIGRLIREARERRAWSQGDLAARLGRTQTAVSYWESGRRVLGVDDLVVLASALGVAPGDLLPDGDHRRPIPTLLRAVAERVDAHVLADELEKFAVRASGLPSLPMRWHVSPSSPRDTAEALLSAAKVVKPPVPITRLVEGCGVRILDWNFQGDIDALVVELSTGAVIWVNPDHAETRRRFSTAHELGHHVLRHADRIYVEFGGDLAPGASGDHPGYDWRAEKAANEFAANLLMPAVMVRKEYEHTSDLKRLAKVFHVSPAAMSIRLTNLQLQ